MVNRHRGEAAWEGPDGPCTMRLSLDALARLETALTAPNLGSLANTLLSADLTASQLKAVLVEALVAGGDVDRPTAEALMARTGRPLVLRQAYVDLMRATFSA